MSSDSNRTPAPSAAPTQTKGRLAPDNVELSAQDRELLEKLLGDFTRTWDLGQLNTLIENLPAQGHPLRAAALHGLIKIDLALRWQRGDAAQVEEYLKRFPELGTVDTVPLSLVLAEYQARQRFGQPPSLNDFAARFPAHSEALRRAAVPMSPSSSVLDLSGSSVRDSQVRLDGGGKEPESEPLPEQFGRYHILRRLGQGGMGTVYLAVDTRLDRQVALKVPRFDPDSTGETLQRFYREARATATINHPNLCPLFDVGEFEGQPYLTMAFIDGWPLSKFVAGQKKLSLLAIATTVRKVALAVAEAHKLGVIHRDLKPGNIMVNKRGEPIVMDFGLARWIKQDKEDVRLTRAGSILGAPVYMSPEQVAGDVEVMGPPCDIYSLGVILYELITGRLPFEGGNATTVLAKSLLLEPKKPTHYRGDLDPQLEAICLKAMSKRVQDRYRSMEELAQVLSDYIRTTRQGAPGATVSGSGSLSTPGGAAPPVVPSSTPAPVPAPLPDTVPEPFQRITSARTGKHAVAAETRSPLGRRPFEKPRRRRIWPWVVGTLVVLMALTGVLLALFLPRSVPEGTIRVELTPDNARVEILLLDGKTIQKADLDKPLTLSPGDHSLVVVGSNFEKVERRFEVRDGNNPILEIRLKVTFVDPGPPKWVELPLEAPFEGLGSPIRGVAFEPTGTRALTGGDDFVARLWNLANHKVIQDFTGHRQPITSVAMSRDGRISVSGSGDASVCVWNLQNNTLFKTMKGHTDWVRSVAVSADGKRALSGGDDRSVRFWNAENGTLLKLCTGHTGVVWAVALSADAKVAVSGSQDRAVCSWNLSTGKVLKQYDGHTDAVRCVALSPDGKRIASGSDDRTIRIWDLANGNLIHRLTGHVGRIRALAFNHDGSRLFSASSGDGDNTIRVWDANNGKYVHALGRHLSGVVALACSADGRRVLSSGDDGSLRMWDAGKASPDPVPTPPTDLVGEVRRVSTIAPVARLAVSTDGTRIAVGGADGAVRLWDQSSMRLLQTLTGHKGSVHWVGFTPDGAQVISAGEDKTVRLWDLASGKEINRYDGHTANVWCAALSPDGKRLLTTGGDKTCIIWDVASKQILKKLAGHTDQINWGDWSPDGTRVLTASWDGTLRLWDATGGQQLKSCTVDNKTGFTTCAFLPDGKRALTGGRDNLVRLWDLDAQKQIRDYKAHSASVYVVVPSPGGRYFFSGGQDRSVFYWEVEGPNPKPLQRWEGHADRVVGAGFTADGTRLITGSGDKTLRVWLLPRTQFDPRPLPTSQEVAGEALRLEGHKDKVEAVAFTLDGKRAVSGSHDNTARIWDLSSGKEATGPVQHAGAVHALAMVPDGRHFVTACWDGNVCVCDLEQGKLVRRFGGHAGRVQAVAVSADGKLVLSGGDDLTVRLWEFDTGNLRDVMKGHNSPIWAVAFSPDGRFALSASHDRTVRFWNITKGTGEPAGQWTAPGALHSVAVLPDSKRVVVAGRDRVVYLVEMPSGKLIGRFQGHRDTIGGLTSSSDGRWVLSGSDDKTSRLWDVETGRETARYTVPQSGVWGAALSPDSKQALAGGPDGVVRLWNLPPVTAPLPVQTIRTFPAAPQGQDRVAVAPDGHLAAAAGMDRKVRIYNASTGELLRTCTGHTDSVRFVCFSPDGKQIASAGADGTIRLWDPETAQEIRRFEGHRKIVWSVAFSPDGKRMVSGGDDQVAIVWDVEKGTRLETLLGHTGGVSSVAWSSDPKRVVTASRDQTLRVWDPDTGEVLRILAGHSAGLAALALSADGRYAASGAVDKLVKLWNVETGECLQTFDGHTGEVWFVAFTGDDRTLLSASQDKTVRLWDVIRRGQVHGFYGHAQGVTGLAMFPDGRRFLSSSLDKTVRLWGMPVR
jgi:WD40 repeat protein/serine/threonine protein kinase